jgi:hypothetical protein
MTVERYFADRGMQWALRLLVYKSTLSNISRGERITSFSARLDDPLDGHIHSIDFTPANNDNLKSGHGQRPAKCLGRFIIGAPYAPLA